MYTNKLWPRFTSFFRSDLRSIPFLSHYQHSHTHSFFPLSSSLPSHDCLGPIFPSSNKHKFAVKLSKFYELETFCSQSFTSGVSRCWNCNSAPHSEPFLVCESCSCIQPVDHSVDYFQIFGLQKKYGIDESSLDGKYKDWQKKLHPDLVHSKSESEREYAAEQSARVIDAYRTLNNSLSRAVYLMKLNDVHVDEEQTVSDPELLAEIMEIRESVEEAADSQALKQIQKQVQEKMSRWSESFAGAFESHDTEGALSAIRRMTYYKRANEEIVKRL